MSNNWKYSTLGQRERLDLIRSGETEAYNYEKNKNDSLKKIQTALGLSTKDVDDWDKTIDNAYSASKASSNKKVAPKYASSRLGEVNEALRSSAKALKQQKNESVAQANADAQSALAYLEEWLASNGYSEHGKLATQSKKELSDALKSLLDSINEEYESQLKSTRSKYLNMVK